MRLFRRAPAEAEEVERLEVRLRTLERVTEDWLSLVREMEASGETGDPRYERYLHAFADARHQQKQVELALFNYHRGLVG